MCVYVNVNVYADVGVYVDVVVGDVEEELGAHAYVLNILYIYIYTYIRKLTSRCIYAAAVYM